ncbi:MAG: hypothetical protein R3F60_03950 [bacterium]
MRHFRLLLAAGLSLSLWGCPEASSPTAPDAGDGAAADAARADAAGPDAQAEDAGHPADAAPADAAVAADVGAPEDAEGPRDASPPPPDAQPVDAAVEADQGLPACDPPLSVTPGLAFARVYDLVTLRAGGGTGDWRFELVQDASGALLNRETGAYLAGERTGVSDIVRVTDEGCVGEVRAEIRVVDALSVAPLAVEVAPRGRFTFRTAGGSGRLAFTLEANASGAQVADDGLFVAGGEAGRDVVRVTDEGTGQVVIATVVVTPEARLVADPPQLFIQVGSTHPMEIMGGSGEFDFDVMGDGVVVEQGRVVG